MSEPTVSRIVLAMAVVSGLGLMLPFLDAGPLSMDEYGSYWIAGSENPGMSWERSLQYAAIPPLSCWFQQAFLAVGGESEIVFRLPSAVCYLIAIALTYLLAREFLGSAASACAALILAWHPGVLDHVRLGRCYGTTLMFAAASFWITVRWLREPHRARWAVAWAVLNVCLLWTHYVNATATVFQLVVLLGTTRRAGIHRERFQWLLLLAVFLLSVASLPLIPAVIRLWIWSPHLNYLRQDASLWTTIGSLWWLGAPVGYLVAKGISRLGRSTGAGTIGTSTGDVHPHRELRWMCLWGPLPLLLAAAIGHGNLTTLAHPKYHLAHAVPSACLLAGIMTFRNSATATFVGTLASLAAAWSVSDVAPWQLVHFERQDAEQWAELAKTIEMEGAAGEPVFVQGSYVESSLVPFNFHDELFLDYVACRVGRFYLKSPHARYGLPFFWENYEDMTGFFAELIATTRQSSRPSLWLAVATDNDLSRQSGEGFQRLLVQQGFVEDRTFRWKGAFLIHYVADKDFDGFSR